MANDIIEKYKEVLKREASSRSTLARAVSAIENATGKYDPAAISAELTAREILDDHNNGLSPLEEAKFGDRMKRADKIRAYNSK